MMSDINTLECGDDPDSLRQKEDTRYEKDDRFVDGALPSDGRGRAGGEMTRW